MINFTEQQSLNSWRITNDGVMGGKSQGQISLQANKAIFSGDISLANNGGFSSVFRPIEPLAKALETVTIDIEGDGLTYQLRLIVNLDGYRMAYKQSFDTVAGQQTQLSFTLADFQASFRGREIPNAPVLTSENIREVGFLVTSKVAGPFSLVITSVSFK
ncbi:CIA30 family protein [Colwellia sp. MB02u-9]|nr:CIA30 family protein [Colwellia sp. MB02u-9]